MRMLNENILYYIIRFIYIFYFSLQITIPGEFRCSECSKICKSKGGLTRHVNVKHPSTTTQEDQPTFTFHHETLKYIIKRVYGFTWK